MKPTEGPWRANGPAIRPANAKGRTGGYAPILVAQHDKRLPDNRVANARLAATAPELLAALQWALAQMPTPVMQGEYTTGWLAAKAAVHKATGVLE